MFFFLSQKCLSPLGVTPCRCSIDIIPSQTLPGNHVAFRLSFEVCPPAPIPSINGHVPPRASASTSMLELRISPWLPVIRCGCNAMNALLIHSAAALFNTTIFMQSITIMTLQLSQGHQTIPRAIWNVAHVQAITSLNLNHNKLKVRQPFTPKPEYPKPLIFQNLNGLDRMCNLETLMLDNNDLTLRCHVGRDARCSLGDL